MITIAGVVFSLTLVALSLASSQLGPRLLRNFMRDTANQIVLGAFIATFLYCLMILRTIRRPEEGAFVPHLAVTIGVFFAIGGMAVLIYFIHHVSVSIQADDMIARVYKDLLGEIDSLFPHQIGHSVDTENCVQQDIPLPSDFALNARQVKSKRDGYLQLIDAEALMTLATETDLLVQVRWKPGHYVVAGSSLALAWPKARVNDAVISELTAAFAIGDERTPSQDLNFYIIQLVQIAVRALSPGINDPFTACTCVDRLGSILCRVVGRKMPSEQRLDDKGQLRVIAPPVIFSDLLDGALNQIRQYARSDVAVTIRLLETIERVAQDATRPEDRSALLRHAGMILRGSREGLAEDEDQLAVEVCYKRVESLCHPIV
jgi:uncharacterized membrane protein